MYKRILLINPFGIGDVLFTTPIIHTLKEAFPGVKIGYLSNRRTVAILENNPYIDYLFVYERDEFEAIRKKSNFTWLKKISRLLNEIKKEQFDASLDFSLNTQYGFFAWYAGIKERIGYNYKNRGWLLTKKIELQGYDDRPIVEYYADLLKLMGLDLRHKKLELYLEQKDKIWADNFLSEKGISSQDLLVAVIPAGGESWGVSAYLKHWPTEKFSALSDKIIENYKAKIIIMGALSERDIVRQILKHIHHKIIDAAGETNLGQFAALLSKVKLVVTNDGGPMHMAVALGLKTVSFFGPVDPKVYGPYPPDDNCYIVMRKNLDCSPCYHKFRLNPCQRKKECLESIDVGEALEAVNKLLG